MKKWKEILLVDYYDISSGLSKPASEFGEGFPFLSFKDVFHNFFVPEELTELVKSNPKEQLNCSIKRGDIFLTRTSEKAEELGMSSVALKDYPNSTFNGFTKRLRPKKNSSILPEFVGFYLRSSKFRADVSAFSNLITRASLNNDNISRLKISLPELPVQQKIASILLAYNKSIENNVRRIQLLEDLAQKYFDCEYSNLNTSETKLENLIEFEIGGGWGEDKQSDEYPVAAFVIRGTDIDKIPYGEINNVPFRYHKNSNFDSRKLFDGDIIFEVSGGSQDQGVGKSLLINNFLLRQFEYDGICASFCKLVRPKERELSNFLFLFLRYIRKKRITEIFEIRSASNIINYNWSAFIKFQSIKTADKSFLAKLNSFIDPIYSEIYNLGNQIRILKQSRDILLPKLMTGQIKVK
jgi:type I restriction enzyme S subunit